MAKNKTAETEVDVTAFLSAVVPDQRRQDGFRLRELMEEISGEPAKMWGPAIVGFGRYHYKYDSGHEGDAPLLGFSPRKAALSLYVYTGLEEHKIYLEKLGKFKMGKVCIYANKLSDLDEPSLRLLMEKTLEYMKANYRTGTQ